MNDSIFYDRARLEIATWLSLNKEALSFNELLEKTKLTKGNLSSHLKKLEDGKMIHIKKEFVDKKPLTTIQISEMGRKAFKNHLTAMQEVLKKMNKV